MAHPQQIDFCKSVKKMLPHFFSNRLVLDIGSLDINGNNQYLFDDCLYIGVDLLPGKNVDLTTRGHELNLPDESVDVVVSTECFEHDQFYFLTLKNIVRMLKPGGLFVFSCATTGRPEHGTRRTTPADAPFTQEFGAWSDYYKNLDERDIRCVLDVDEIFQKYAFSIGTETCDIYFWGVKKGHLIDRSDYSFQILQSAIRSDLREKNALLAELLATVAQRDDQVKELHQRVAEREKHIAVLNQSVARWEEAWTLSRREFAGVLASTSWKLTQPLRQLMGGCHLLMARLRLLLMRSRFVLRQEGVSGFVRRTIGFVGRYRRRKASAKSLARFVMDAGAPVSAQKTPLVSFVIPIHDRTDLLRAAVKSALGQTLPVFEVLLITDGSPPSTLAVVDEFHSDPRVRIFHYPVSSGNAVRGRNKGILEARGRYIAFLDSDDIAAPDRLEVCLPILEAGVADVVYGSWRALLDGTREIDGLTHGQVVHSPDCDLTMLEGVCVPCQSTVMVRRETLLDAGFLKPRMQYREDHELWARLAYHGARFKSVAHVLTDLRLHAGNNELNFKGDDAHWRALLKAEYRLPGPRPQKIAFLLAGLGISGGAAVVLKHVSMLMEAGHDAFVIDIGGHGDIAWFGNPGIRVYRLEDVACCGLDNIDLLFATFWTTVAWLQKIPARRKLYLVQSDERLFYDDSAQRAQVAGTYRLGYEYVAIAQWLVNMLCEEFHQRVTYLPNGIDGSLFYPDEPLESKNPQRLRVLIEGPISVPFKGVADAYAACNTLDCELWIISSNGRPQLHWRYDRFFEGVGLADMRRIYSSCDVLLKMSQVESFAYPPLEAMACGCTVVMGEVSGGIEYALDGDNVLKVPRGDVGAAKAALMALLTHADLRERLRVAGFATAKQWSWDASRAAMLDLISAPPPDSAPALRSVPGCPPPLPEWGCSSAKP